MLAPSADRRAVLSSLQFIASFSRGGKYAPEIGPQAFGLTPLLTKFEVKPRNNWPTALCQPTYALADNPTDQVRCQCSRCAPCIQAFLPCAS